MLTGKKTLVVGGAGFVGSNLVKRLLLEDPEQVIVVDNLLSADISQVPMDKRVSFHHASITEDPVLYRLPNDLDYVFHLATFHGNQSSMADPLADHQNNTLTSLKLFDRLKDFPNLKKVVYASAGCTVAKKTFEDTTATTEDSDVSLYLDSPYQISKIIGEFYGNYYFMRHDLPIVKARFQNVYGPGEILGAGDWRGTVNTIWRNVTPTFIFKALHEEALPVENQGIATRDFIHVDDIVSGLIACATHGELGGVYNLASGEETSILELANLINKVTKNPTPIAMSPARSWDRSGKRFGDPSKAKQEIDFECTVAFKEGLAQTIAWYKENMDLMKSCMRQHYRYAPDLDQYGIMGYE